jgi:hypothetical protein
MIDEGQDTRDKRRVSDEERGVTRERSEER